MEPQEPDLNEELLAAAAQEHAIVPEAKEPKRNSKQGLIDKILEISEREGIPLTCSNTKLKRMNKQQLSELCADLIEQGIRKKMARAVNSESTDDRTIALGALRMLHDVVAVGVEKGANSFTEPYGYTIDGFSENLKEPAVSSAIDGCLQEIADQNQELLEYVQSPYTRLMIAWGGALAFSCKRTNKHVTFVESRPPRRQVPVRSGGSRRPTNGQVNPSNPPPESVKTV